MTNPLRWFKFAETQPAKAAAPDLTDYGATGTPIFGGFLRELGEYNAEFQDGPFAAYTTYEKMRRSDAQVAATLAAIKLPIRSAGWTITAPGDASPVEQEATDLARSCLCEELDLDAVIENALLMLDFGCAAHEDIWYVDGNRVRLKALAPRMPLTFYRWICKDGGDELEALGQLGYRGGKYVHAEVPVEKLVLFTHQKEGANFAGRSLLRPMYQHWYIKSNLYKIDAIACERNGMGVPWAMMGPDAKTEDRKEAISWLEKLSAHEKAAILIPPGWQWGLEGVKGTTRDPKDSIHHHNLQISMAGLAMFMNLGQTTSGSRSLGETMADFFAMSVQAAANQIARVISLTTIKRLVDFNFTGVERYPRLVPLEILSVKFESIVAALKDLAAASVNVVQPDDELESWLRKKMGAPEKGTPRQRPVAQAVSPAAAVEKLQASATGRPPRGAEKCLALAAIVSELDRGRDETAAAMRRARSRVEAEIVNKLVNMPVANLHRASIAPDAKLTAEIEQILQRAYNFGVAQVAEERGRQLQTAATIRLAANRTPLGLFADGVVGEFVNNLTARAVNVALDWMRRPGGKTKGEIIRSIEDDLDGQSDKWIDGAASKGANEAFAEGRADGYEQHKDEIQSVVYSALLDINTCENCAAADGEEGATPEDITDVPNPDCDGGDKCRCVHVFVFSDEVRQ